MTQKYLPQNVRTTSTGLFLCKKTTKDKRWSCDTWMVCKRRMAEAFVYGLNLISPIVRQTARKENNVQPKDLLRLALAYTHGIDSLSPAFSRGLSGFLP